jgi:hypothetical protein
MGWFNNVEKTVAHALVGAFTDAKTLANAASDDVVEAEAALITAKQKAANLTAAAHQAALAAVEKAQAETESLVAEAQAAAERAAYHAGLVAALPSANDVAGIPAIPPATPAPPVATTVNPVLPVVPQWTPEAIAAAQAVAPVMVPVGPATN